jgi:diguanylate cyclase (GGDEF)-like protein
MPEPSSPGKARAGEKQEMRWSETSVTPPAPQAECPERSTPIEEPEPRRPTGSKVLRIFLRGKNCAAAWRAACRRPDVPGNSAPGWCNLARSEVVSSLLAVLGGILLVALVAFSDFLIGPDLSIALFYLVPIAALAWRGGYAYGILVSLAAAVTWYGIDVVQRPSVLPGIRLWNGAVHLSFFAVAAGVLARLRDALRNERMLARTDALTGAANARIFYESARRELERSLRVPRPFTVAYFDLDDFKAVNDQLGHSTGDEVLRRVASVIRHNIRGIDLLARLGGDEFALLFPDTDAAGATAALLKLREALRYEIVKDGWKVTFSIGAATFVEPPADVDTVVHKVDALMYEAKHGGKNRVRHEVVLCPQKRLDERLCGERRSGVRFLCGAPASVAVLCDLTDEPQFATIRDLSTQGIGLYLGTQLASGTLLTVEPVRSSRAKTLLVRVVHCRSEPGGWFHGGQLAGFLSEQELKDWLE